MPRKPEKEVVDAAKKKLNPHDVMCVVIGETPELREALLKAGLVKEVKNE